MTQKIGVSLNRNHINKCNYYINTHTHTLTGHFIRYTLLVPGWTPFCLQNCLNSSWHRFNKLLETFLRDFGPYWHDSITQLLQICRLHIHESLVPPHPKGALLDWDLVTVEAIWVKWTHCHVQETSLRWFELCDIVHYPARSSHQKMNRWDKAGWIHAFMFFTPDSDPTIYRSRNRDSSDQATFFQSSVVQFWWVIVNCILRFLFLADRSGTRCGLLLL